jgi:hypothetical protein
MMRVQNDKKNEKILIIRVRNKEDGVFLTIIYSLKKINTYNIQIHHIWKLEQRFINCACSTQMVCSDRFTMNKSVDNECNPFFLQRRD